MKHKIKLSNGCVVVLEEGDDELHICSDDEAGVDWWIATISCNGVLVAPNSGSEPEILTRGLLADESKQEKE